MSYIPGYTVAHDVSARDWQLHKNGGQWLLGKTFDTFCPLGPAIVTPSGLSGQHQIKLARYHMVGNFHGVQVFVDFMRSAYP